MVTNDRVHGRKRFRRWTPETSSLDPPQELMQRGSQTRTPTRPCFTGHSRMHRIGVKRSSLQLEIYFDQRQRGLQSRWERVRAGISRRFLPSLNDISQQNLPSRDSTLLPLLCSFVIIGMDTTNVITRSRIIPLHHECRRLGCDEGVSIE